LSPDLLVVIKTLGKLKEKRQCVLLTLIVVTFVVGCYWILSLMHPTQWRHLSLSTRE